MDIREPFRSALASLRANKMRTALTALGIVIGVSAVIAAVSMVQGFKGIITGIMERYGSNVVRVEPVNPRYMLPDEFKKIKSTDMTMYDMRALAMELPQVILNVTPSLGTSGTLRYSGASTSAFISMSDETFLEQNRFNLDLGRNFVPADMRLKSKVAIIGKLYIENLGITGDPVGQFISINDMSFEIIGVMEDLGSSMITGDNNHFLMIPITTGMEMISDSQRRQMSFTARYEPSLDADYVEDVVTDAMRRIRGLKSNETAGFSVTTMKKAAAEFNLAMLAISGIATGVVSIALVVGGVGIMNIMLVAVTERTREIGIRKAVGARRGHILTQFLIEALVLCLLGGAVGILLGYLLGALASKIIFNQVPGIPLSAYIIGFGVPAAIGIFFGYYPAAKASKLDPIESLRYE
jgi:putative ABC transport system permease protein